MGKRKHEEIRRRIRELEAQLVKKKRRRIIESSSEEEFEDHVDDSQGGYRSETPVVVVRQGAPSRGGSDQLASFPANSPRGTAPSPTLPAPPRHDLRHYVSPPPSPSLPVDTIDTPGDKNLNCTEELELDDEILQLLGDAPKMATELGPPIYKDIASRWHDILSKGLPKDAKDKLLKQYSVPSNCSFLLAPILNPEAKAALADGLVKRDFAIAQKQNQLGLALSALATATELIISGETSKQKILGPLSDACRTLCDNHYIDTKTRRNFVLSSINSELKDTLIECDRDKFLFGENVSDKLKMAKNIQRSGDILKNQQKTFTKTNFAVNRNLNYKFASRKTEQAASSTARLSRQLPQRQPRGARNSSSSGRRRAPHRSPPRRYTRHK